MQTSTYELLKGVWPMVSYRSRTSHMAANGHRLLAPLFPFSPRRCSVVNIAVFVRFVIFTIVRIAWTMALLSDAPSLRNETRVSVPNLTLTSLVAPSWEGGREGGREGRKEGGREGRKEGRKEGMYV